MLECCLISNGCASDAAAWVSYFSVSLCRERLETVESGQEVCLHHVPGLAHHQGIQGQDCVCH